MNTAQQLNFAVGFLSYVRSKMENFKKHGTHDQINAIKRIELDAKKEVKRLEQLNK